VAAARPAMICILWGMTQCLNLRRFSIAVLIALSVAACTGQAQDEEPELKTSEYLEQELAALQGADPATLSDSMRRVREALKEDADTGDLLVAWWAENHRRLEQSDVLKDRKLPPLLPLLMPEGTNGWDDLVEAGETAERLEKVIGNNKYASVTSGRPLERDEAKSILADSEKAIELLRKADKAKHLTIPDYGMPSQDASHPALALWRVMTLRVHAHLAIGDRENALQEAEDAVRILGRAEYGASSLCALLARVACTIVFEGVIQLPGWKADELQNLLDATTERIPRASWILYSEALNFLSATKHFATSDKKEVARFFGFTREGNTSLGDLLEKQVKSSLESTRIRVEAATWAHERAGDIRSADYAEDLLGLLNGDNPVGWRNSIAGDLEPLAMLVAARVKLAWLQGKRGDELKSAAKELEEQSAAFTVSIGGRVVRIAFKTDHPLAEENPSKPVCEIELSGE
jgi:hypothetical protein